MLLMGGQACVLYGAAEFSRDLDLLVLAEPENLARLRAALAELQAEPIAVPPFNFEYLERGHALHFRCRREDVAGLRIDVMAKLREVDAFDKLWVRRTTIEVEGEQVDMLALEDLVAAKKTQRPKDWPMIQRLFEGAYLNSDGSAAQVEFLLRELRTPELLIDLAGKHTDAAHRVGRPAVDAALRSDIAAVEAALHDEEIAERARYRAYWEPLKRELEQMRRARH
jgi:hypothetical protein